MEQTVFKRSLFEIPGSEREVVYSFGDGDFILVAATYGSQHNDARIIFRVRTDRNPHERATEKGVIGYDRLIPADAEQIEAWLDSHPDYAPTSFYETDTPQSANYPRGKNDFNLLVSVCSDAQ